MRFTSADIIHYHFRREAMEKEIADIDAEIPRLQERRQMLKECIEASDGMTTVIEGIPLHISERNVTACGDEINRYAGFYQNANNPGAWCLQVYDRPHRHLHAKEHWCGGNWPDMKTAQQAAIHWVVYGTMPKRRG